MSNLATTEFSSYLTLKETLDNMPQATIEYKHYFSDGVYTREMYAPKDSILLGKVHKTNTINILLKGSVAIHTDEDNFIILTAPTTFVSDAGLAKFAVTLEDIIWINSFATTKTDIEEIEKDVTFSETELLSIGA